MEYSNSYSMASDIWGPGVPSYIPSQPTVHRNAAAHRHHEPNITYPPSKAKKRTNIACNRCRDLKAKCTGTRPCERCTSHGENCIYPDPPSSTEDQAIGFVERLETIEFSAETMIDRRHRLPLDHEIRMGPVLEWSVIKKLVGPYLKEAGISYISEYPVRQEQERGSLILLDRSEVSFSSRQASLPTDHGCRGLADSPFAASTSPPLDGGFIEVKSGLDFTESNVWLYVQRFKDNILSMHPIIGPNDLDCLVSSFMSRMLDSQPRRPQFGDTLAGSNTTQIQTKQLERSSTSAMVLLVLALGEVCLHRGKIPDLIDHQEKTRSPQTRSNKQPSPAESSYLDSSNLALHQQNKRTSHYSSWDGEADSKEELIVTR